MKDVAVVERVAAQLNLDLGFLATVVAGGPMDVSGADRLSRRPPASLRGVRAARIGAARYQVGSELSSMAPAIGPPPLPTAATFALRTCRPIASPRSCMTASWTKPKPCNRPAES